MNIKIHGGIGRPGKDRDKNRCNKWEKRKSKTKTWPRSEAGLTQEPEAEKGVKKDWSKERKRSKAKT
mgnify:CR=1 FL=1